MNDPILLRRDIRKVLALDPNPAPGKELTEKLLHDAVNRLCRQELAADEFREALLWNHTRDYVSKRHDEDRGADVWLLTPEGRKKEGLR